MTETPSEARKKVLDEHAVIREKLDALRGLADALRAGDSGAAKKLAEGFDDFGTYFLEHLDHEEGWILPWLREIPGFANERIEALLEEHAEQRTSIERILKRLRSELDDPERLAGDIERFAERLSADMSLEEGLHLSPKVLRDDIIAVDFGG